VITVGTRKILTVLLVAIVAAAGCGKDDADAEGADRAGTVGGPALNGTNFAEIMQTFARGEVKPHPWVGYWFPYTAGGVVASAQKYDAAYGAEHPSLAQWEVGNHGAGHPQLESWFGHCNGWAASSLSVLEPREPKMINGVQFDVADQKALLAESWLEFSGDFIGTRVMDEGDTGSTAFWDIAPAQFHLILANLTGKQARGLILDRHTGWEIWNQPLAGYMFDKVRPEDYIGAHPQFPDVYRVNVTARIWWANDNVAAGEISNAFNMEALREKFFDPHYPGRLLRYELWLDGPVEFDTSGNLTRSGNILMTQEFGRYVGGMWKNGGEANVNSHPDFMWVPYGRQFSSGYKNPRIDDNWVRDNVASELRAN
jgi:hypothetical protein